MTPDDLLQLHLHPATAGRRACAVRRETTGETITIRPAPSASVAGAAAIVRGDHVVSCDAWPSAARLEPGDRVVLHVPANADGRTRFASWLVEQSPDLPGDVSLSPYCREAAGLHRLWCVAAARLAAPSHVRIEARHDLLGIRLAQIALGFGADTVSGPIEPDRRLPLAGVPRPNEATPAGLSAAIRQAGLTPVVAPVLAGAPASATREAS